MRLLLLALSAFLGSAVLPSGWVHADAALCVAAGRAAAAETGVPSDLMAAIALAETGRRQAGGLEPWPWAINAGGKGTWHSGRTAALAAAAEHLASGRRNFDLGCFQINHRWHGDHFTSLEDMIEPTTNAAYAARFLTELHRETGDWMIAAGLYHSRTPLLAARYRHRVARLMRRSPLQLAAKPSAIGRRDDSALAEPEPATVSSGQSAPTLFMVGMTQPGRFIETGAGQALIDAASGRLMVRKASGPLIRRLPRAARPPGPGGLFAGRGGRRQSSAHRGSSRGAPSTGSVR
ncbi:MAG: hypothetical protein AAF371_06880 [Pseudomonadota bacterium]